ncbi:hypothetical protein BaRGS_00002985 [Batillaria attramentaria]|uniref:XK-related protein n=1 Tax=Batillaria attramentaria TaxID=370345 RepID=A0ABD0M1B6_9CAEN
MDESDRQQPTEPGESVITLEDVTSCAETENGDRTQPTELGEDGTMREYITPLFSTETEGTGDTQATCSHVESMADSERQQPTAPDKTAIMVDAATRIAEVEDEDRQQPTAPNKTAIMVDAATRLAEVEDEDRQQPTEPNKTAIMVDAATRLAEGEDEDRQQPTEPGENGIMLEDVTHIASTETEGSDDTQAARSQSCGAWKPCMFAKWLWGIIYDKDNGDFTRLDLVLGVVSIIIYFVDIGSDVRLAVGYFQDGQWIYGGLTTAFIVVAYICLLALWLYRHEHGDDQSRLWWICRHFLAILGLIPVVATLESMYYGWRCRTRQSDKTKYIYVAAAPADLRLAESFLESAPQLCFQLYVVFKGDDDDSAGTLLFNAGGSTDSGWLC